MSKASQSGFTLIELVVVIVILGVLAAFAVPRFMGLESQARIAALRSLSGSVKSAATLAHSSQIAQSLTANTAIVVEGANIAMLNGYPTLATIDNLITDITNNGFAYAPATGTFSKTGAPTPATCSFTYTAATPTLPPVVSALNTAGC